MRSTIVLTFTGAMLAAFALSGCITSPPLVPAAEVFVVDFTIVDLSSSSGTRFARAGHHCGDVAKDDETLTVSLWPNEAPPDGPWLAVFFELPDRWTGGGDGEPYKTTFPARIDPNVGEDPTILGRLSWEAQGGNGTLRVNGDAVSLPHSWSVTGHDGSWRADAVLDAWTGPVATERYTGFCD